jgi:hypothetical protein
MSHPKVSAFTDTRRASSSNATKIPGVWWRVGAADQHLEREDRLAAAGAAHKQGRAPQRQSAGGDIVETFDAAGYFFQEVRPLLVAQCASRLPR